MINNLIYRNKLDVSLLDYSSENDTYLEVQRLEEVVIPLDKTMLAMKLKTI